MLRQSERILLYHRSCWGTSSIAARYGGHLRIPMFDNGSWHGHTLDTKVVKITLVEQLLTEEYVSFMAAFVV
ncbi:hypothetical protein O9929_13170 [Vibrio lentus]|nr:hypothetical protein [Vibrio lentus]